MKTLRDWQEADVTEALAHDSWFIAYEMGLGKTLVSVEWAKRKGDIDTIVVILPLSTIRSWTRTFNEQWPEMPVFRLNTKNKEGTLAFGKLKKQERGVYLIGWEMMRSGALTGTHADLIIADETHKQANFNKSLQSVMIQEIKGRYKLALSGTPAANRPDGIFATLNWLWPKQYKSYHNWIEKYWRTIRNGAIIELVRELKPGQIVADIPMFTRRLVKDHAEDLPGRLPERVIEVELSAAQRKVYTAIEKESGVWLDEGRNFLPTIYSLETDIRLRQIALGVPTMVEDEKTGKTKVTFAENTRSSKIDALIETVMLDEFRDDTFLVLTHSAQIIPAVVAQLRKKKISAAPYYGELSAEVKERTLEDFGTKFRVLVAGLQGIGTGTDGLQYKCHNEFWLSKHPEWLVNEQGSSRLDRPGGGPPVNVWYCVAKDTRDEASMERLKEIGQSLSDMLDTPPDLY